MKQLFIIGNWKSNKTEAEASDWLQRFKIQDLGFRNKEIIICPSFPILSSLKSYFLNHKSAVKLGAQDISMFDEGAYTGEVNGKQIKEFCDYVIIGHSERRKHIAETEEVVGQKIAQAIKFGLTPIVCVSEIEQIDDKWKMINGKLLIAYEPLFAIGSGNADTPENANAVAKKIKEIMRVQILYGGSVTEKNIASFTKMEDIDGVLVGKASLDPHIFASLIINA